MNMAFSKRMKDWLAVVVHMYMHNTAHSNSEIDELS